MGSALLVPFEFAFRAAQQEQEEAQSLSLYLSSSLYSYLSSSLHSYLYLSLHSKLLSWGLQQEEEEEEGQCRITVTLLQHSAATAALKHTAAL